MDYNIVEVIPGILGEVQPTGCIISTLTKCSKGYANRKLRINGEWKTFTAQCLGLEYSLGLQMGADYFACQTYDVRNSINSNHLWEVNRRENYQYRLKKGRIKNVGTTWASQPQKKLRGLDIISGIRTKIQPNGSRICTLAKRSDGYAIKGTKSKGKTKSFYAHRLVRSHKLGLPVQPGYFTCHSWDDRGCVNSDHL